MYYPDGDPVSKLHMMHWQTLYDLVVLTKDTGVIRGLPTDAVLEINLFLQVVGTCYLVYGARHFVERHFVNYDTLSKVFVELPVCRKVTSSNAFSSNTTLSRTFA